MATRLGSEDYIYEELADWAQLPEDWSFKEVADVVVDAQDRVYVFNRGEHPMIIFEADGSFVTSWGEDLFSRAHGVTIGPDGMLYCVDDGDHSIRKCTPDGEVLMTIGTPGEPAPAHSGQPFNRPTKVAFDPKTDELYISDGYGNARVHKFSPDGQHLFRGASMEQIRGNSTWCTVFAPTAQAQYTSRTARAIVYRYSMTVVAT